MSKIIDLTGQKFNRLTVISRAENTSEGRAQWNCVCECGEKTVVSGKSLRNGNTKSCGCLSKDKARDRLIEKHQKNAQEKMIGKKFGKLTVLKDSGKRSACGNIIYICQCECGNICERIGSNLVTSKNIGEYISSCGCIYSPGEEKIIKILSQNNIKYEQEKTFDTCIFYDTNKKARFDFYIPNPGYIIEYDGQQHFNYSDEGWNKKDKFLKTQEHDKIKNQWCFNNNIPIIRIPYTQLSKLKLQDLILETSQFIIKDERIEYE